MLISLSHKQNEAGRTCTLNQPAHQGEVHNHVPKHDKVDSLKTEGAIPEDKRCPYKISNRELARL